MTSPVRMGTDSNANTMSFVIPSEYDLEELPDPNDGRIELHNTVPEYTASIKFGGWADNSTIEKKKQELFKILDEMEIKHSEVSQYLGYNPPYQMINRRNEVLVELKDFNLEVLNNKLADKD